jgi:hypothetical protein
MRSLLQAMTGFRDYDGLLDRIIGNPTPNSSNKRRIVRQPTIVGRLPALILRPELEIGRSMMAVLAVIYAVSGFGLLNLNEHARRMTFLISALLINIPALDLSFTQSFAWIASKGWCRG